MLAILIACVLVGILTFYQVHTQGLFGSLIMAVLSIVAALISLNYFEQLSDLLSGLGLALFGPRTISLMGLFIISLLLLRELFDRLVQGNMNFPLIVDRVGSVLFGLVASLVSVGMIAIGIQSLPIPQVFLMFDRYPDLADSQADRTIFPNVDGFVLGLASQASDYCFAGSSNFSQVHPDMLRQLYLNRIALDPASRREAAADSLAITSAYVLGQEMAGLTDGIPILADRGGCLIAVRASISMGAGGKKNRGAGDVDGKIRCTLGNFRLVGYDRTDRHGEGYSVYPLGVLKPGGRFVDAIGLDKGKVFSDRGVMDLVFDWPAEVEKVSPLFLEFKGTARADLPAASVLAAAGPSGSAFDSAKTAQRADMKLAGGAEAGYHCDWLGIVSSGGALPYDELVFPTSDQLASASADGKLAVLQQPDGADSKYLSGHVFLPIPTKDTGPRDRPPLYIPDGYAMVVLHITATPAMSMGTVPLPVLVGADGTEYLHAGWSFSGNIGKTRCVEFAYSVTELDTASGRLKRPFPRKSFLTSKNAKASKIALFYLVRRDQQAVGILAARMRTGGAAAQVTWTFADDVEAVTIPGL